MYRKHKNTHKTYKHRHISTNILKCIHTHTHAAQFMYVKFPFLLLNVSCSMKAHVLKVWVVDGLLKSDWTVGLSIIRGLAHWWWNGLLDLAGESRSILRALGAYLASLLSLCVFVSAFPFPSAIRWASLFSRMLCTGTLLYRMYPQLCSQVTLNWHLWNNESKSTPPSLWFIWDIWTLG